MTQTETLSEDLKEILAVYRENGFKIFDWRDGEVRRVTHCIRFKGDYPDEGLRAAELALHRGFPIFLLRLEWNYDSYLHDEGPKDYEISPYWELSFFRYESIQHNPMYAGKFHHNIRQDV